MSKKKDRKKRSSEILHPVRKTDRGFQLIPFPDANGKRCTLQQSSAIEHYDDGPCPVDCPGSSFVWIGIDGPQRPYRMHLSRHHVAELVQVLQGWLETGSLKSE